MTRHPRCIRCEWEAEYAEAMQWRDWQTCDEMLERQPRACKHDPPEWTHRDEEAA